MENKNITSDGGLILNSIANEMSMMEKTVGLPQNKHKEKKRQKN